MNVTDAGEVFNIGTGFDDLDFRTQEDLQAIIANIENLLAESFKHISLSDLRELQTFTSAEISEHYRMYAIPESRYGIGFSMLSQKLFLRAIEMIYHLWNIYGDEQMLARFVFVEDKESAIYWSKGASEARLAIHEVFSELGDIGLKTNRELCYFYVVAHLYKLFRGKYGRFSNIDQY